MVELGKMPLEIGPRARLTDPSHHAEFIVQITKSDLVFVPLGTNIYSRDKWALILTDPVTKEEIIKVYGSTLENTLEKTMIKLSRKKGYKHYFDEFHRPRQLIFRLPPKSRDDEFASFLDDDDIPF